MREDNYAVYILASDELALDWITWFHFLTFSWSWIIEFEYLEWLIWSNWSIWMILLFISDSFIYYLSILVVYLNLLSYYSWSIVCSFYCLSSHSSKTWDLKTKTTIFSCKPKSPPTFSPTTKRKSSKNSSSMKTKKGSKKSSKSKSSCRKNKKKKNKPSLRRRKRRMPKKNKNKNRIWLLIS